MKSSGIGGQAVMEGIMMRNGSEYSVAVRKENGEIEVKKETYKGVGSKCKLFRLPFIRGIFSFVDSLVLGMKSLNYSASLFMEDGEEEEEPGRFEKWLQKKFGDKAEKVIMDLTMVISIILAMGIFMVFPTWVSTKSSSELWSKDLYGNGTTMEDTMKDSVMEQLHEMYTLQAHMKDYDVSVTKDEKAAIKKAAQQFISDNSSEALKEMTADEDTVEELLTLYTIRSKMQKAIEAEADTNVTDEEANERGYTMMTISTTSHQDDSGNTVEYTDDEKKQLKETANKIEDAVKNGKTLEDAAKDEDQQTTTGAYASDDSTLDTSVKKALDDLKEGETSDVIETDSALYIVRLDSETDKDATEKNRQNIIDKRKSDHYNEVLEGWQKKDGWKVNKKNVAKISFKNSLTQQDPNASTETQTSTETQNAESTQ